MASEIADAGGSTLALHADVTQSDSLAAAVAQTVARFGRLDTVVAAAGITINGDPVSMAEADWDRLMDINLKGVFLTCKHTLPEIEQARVGCASWKAKPPRACSPLRRRGPFWTPIRGHHSTPIDTVPPSCQKLMVTNVFNGRPRASADRTLCRMLAPAFRPMWYSLAIICAL